MTDPNFPSGAVWTGDNLNVLRGMNSECVDLIYLDPPFNSNRTYEAPIGSKAAGAAFKDAWTLDDVDVHEHGELADRNPAAHAVIEAARQAHGKGMMAYCIMMAVRLLEMRRVLKPAGSIYLHCDPTASHYLKMLMDGIFGKANFRNEIVWERGTASGGKAGGRKFVPQHDTVLAYAASPDFNFNRVHTPYTDAYIKKRFKYTDEDGRRYRLQVGNRRQYLDQSLGKPVADIWTDINPINPMAKEKIGYPTQKPLALLERIIRASTNEGDLVLDPFCGCATALVAADRLQRRWAGIDLSPLAVRLVNDRIAGDRGLWGGATALDAPPVRTDLGELPNYRTHRHRLYGLQEGNCAGCETHFPFRVMEVDHILPRSRGGTDHAGNLQMLCSGCNRSKGGRTMAEWRASQ